MSNTFGGKVVHKSGRTGRYTGQPIIGPNRTGVSYTQPHPPKPHGPANAAPPRKPNSKLGTQNAIPPGRPTKPRGAKFNHGEF